MTEIFDLSETNVAGFLPPSMTTAERDAIVAPAAGLLIFNTDTTQIEGFDGVEWRALLVPPVQEDYPGRNMRLGNATPIRIPPRRRLRNGEPAMPIYLENARGRREMAGRLAQTHTFQYDETAIDTAVRFPSRVRPITFELRVKRTAAGSNGILFEMGSDADRGMAAWVDGSTLGFAAGHVSSDEGLGVFVEDAMPAVDRPYLLTFVIIPPLGRVNVFVDNKLVIEEAAAGTFNGDWADAGQGAVGAPEGTTTLRVPAAQRVALVDAEIVSPLRAYQGQTPRSGV